jgi:hypothetical protein
MAVKNIQVFYVVGPQMQSLISIWADNRVASIRSDSHLIRLINQRAAAIFANDIKLPKRFGLPKHPNLF